MYWHVSMQPALMFGAKYLLMLLCNTIALRGNFHLQNMRSKFIWSISHIQHRRSPAVKPMSWTKMATKHNNTQTPSHSMKLFSTRHCCKWWQAGHPRPVDWQGLQCYALYLVSLFQEQCQPKARFFKFTVSMATKCYCAAGSKLKICGTAESSRDENV